MINIQQLYLIKQAELISEQGVNEALRLLLPTGIGAAAGVATGVGGVGSLGMALGTGTGLYWMHKYRQFKEKEKKEKLLSKQAAPSAAVEKYIADMKASNNAYHDANPGVAQRQNELTAMRRGSGDRMMNPTEFMDNAQMGLSMSGVAPGAGIIPDTINAGISGARSAFNAATGDWDAAKGHLGNVGVNIGSAVPVAGLVPGLARANNWVQGSAHFGREGGIGFAPYYEEATEEPYRGSGKYDHLSNPLYGGQRYLKGHPKYEAPTPSAPQPSTMWAGGDVGQPPSTQSKSLPTPPAQPNNTTMNKLSHSQRHMLLKHAGAAKGIHKLLQRAGWLPKTNLGDNANFTKHMSDAQYLPASSVGNPTHKLDSLRRNRTHFRSPAVQAGNPTGQALTHPTPGDFEDTGLIKNVTGK